MARHNTPPSRPASMPKTERAETTDPEIEIEVPKEPPPLPAAPKPAPAAPAPVPFFRDPECAELNRHRPNCDCKGDARKPIA